MSNYLKWKGAMISQDITHRLVTDTQINTWNNKANASHTHTKSQITDFPTIPTTLKNPNSIVIKLNGGSTEGTNMFTYDGSTARSINITPAGIGAAAASHIHTKSQIIDFPSSMKNPNSIVIKLNGGTTEGTNMFTYDGSSSKSINITADALGAAASDHSHSNYYDANTERYANNVLAAPNGSNGKATFRLLQPADIAGFGNIPINPVTSSTDTPAKWWDYRNSVSFITLDNTLVGQPSTYGLVLNINWQGSDSAQLWFTQDRGNVFHRQGNSNGWAGPNGGWVCFLDSWNYSNYCLPLSGGTVNGSIGVTGSVSASNVSANGYSVGNHNEYIYNNSTGDILFRYRESADGNDQYTSIRELRHGIVRMGDALPSGVDLNNYLESAVYMLSGNYVHSPVNYGVFLTFKPTLSATTFIGQLVIGGSIGFNLFWRFRDERGNWGKWYYSDKKTATAGN